MSKSIIVSYEGKPCYPILLTQDYKSLPEELEKLNCRHDQKICIVTDIHVADLHLEALKGVLNTCFDTVTSFCFPAGEEQKNLNTVQKLYEHLIFHHFDRHDILVAFGGGVVGDLTGFTAATYLRGIDFIQIPTTLLSQVDSSIGGKTGVDFSKYKNMVGAFYQPRLVYMNLSLHHTLPKEQFVSGMGEILKHGLIKSNEYFRWLKKHHKEILALQPDVVEEMIYRSCLIKRGVVERDPREKGERALLNFGHTIGHAVETLSDFKLFHGQCVGIGMAGACQISRDLGHISGSECDSIIDTLTYFGLPNQIVGLTADEILRATKADKKMNAGKIKFILLEAIGCAYINPNLSDAQILSGISSILDIQPEEGGRREEE